MTSRFLFLPLLAFITLGCGSSNADFGGTDEDSGAPSDTASGGDCTNTDSSTSKDTNGGGDTTSTKDTSGGGDTTSTDAPGPDTPTPTDSPATCAAGTDCGGVCVDTSGDPKNCGGCGKAVCHTEICKGGAPACYPGFKACGATGCLGCRDIQSDPKNCGDCGNVCGTGQTCRAGRCDFGVVDCGGGLMKCGAGTTAAPYCADTDRDEANCGSCGKVCGPTEICVGGTCETYTGAPGCTSCGGCAACTDPTSNCCTPDGFGGPRCVAGDCP